MKIKSFSFLLFALLITVSALCQKIIVNGRESTGKLSWPDFTGTPDKAASWLAYTAYKIQPKVSDIKIYGDSIVVGTFELVLELDPQKSWVKENKVSDDLLIHEQGHFNIGILNMREILAKYKAAKFNRSNFNEKLQDIFTQATAKFHEMGMKYDEETNHSADKEQQLKWNKFFEEQLSL